MSPFQHYQIDALTVQIYDSAEAVAIAAAQSVFASLIEVPQPRLVFATGRSQRPFLQTLLALSQPHKALWSAVVGFHLDEYLGLTTAHPASFQSYLRRYLVSHLPFQAFHFIQGTTLEPLAECDRYEGLLRAGKQTWCLLGIGDNGHLAFNDPAVADFQDPRWVKLVQLDGRNRQQQVETGDFANLEAVPQYAFTLTLSAICAAEQILCLVTGEHKATVIQAMLQGAITPSCPASILRTQPQAKLLLDRAAARLIEGLN